MEPYIRKLELIRECIKKLSEIKKTTPSLEKYRNSWKDKDSTERNLHKIIEAFIDMGKMLIADKNLRGPGNNREVFLILEEHGVFPSKYIPLMDKMIGMRNIIVHSYDRIDDAIVYGALKKSLGNIKSLCDYLERTIAGTSKDKRKS